MVKDLKTNSITSDILYCMKNYIILLIVLFGCEDLTESPDLEIINRRVTVSVYNFGIEYFDGEPFVWAKGKVKNYGPGGPIWNIEIHLQTNYGTQRIAYSIPWSLDEGEIGDWEINPTYGTYVKSKVAVYSE